MVAGGLGGMFMILTTLGGLAGSLTPVWGFVRADPGFSDRRTLIENDL